MPRKPKPEVVLLTKDETESALVAAAAVMTGIHFKVWSHVVEGLNANIARCSRTEYDRQHRLEELRDVAWLVAEGYGNTLFELVGEDEETPEEEVKVVD